MAPKHESHVTDERKAEIKEMLEERGFDTERLSKPECEWIDRALKAHWKLPTTHEAEALKSADPKGKQKKNLRTYVIHAAREHLGEPVGQKHEA